MKVVVSVKDGQVAAPFTETTDKKSAKRIKHLARNRFYQRQVNMPDA